ncbi:MAG: isopenicillin-N epimerase [Phycisphaerae bacterium]|nr:MAG: isopenicillin-N epimerase [Phycisphaerae bacterium]
MIDRRGFLGGAAGLAAASMAGAAGEARTAPAPSVQDLIDAGQDGRTPEQAATDEDYWSLVQASFMVDRSVVNLNNGGVSPCPTIAHEALKRRLDVHNAMPTSYALWSLQHPQIETVRSRLAAGWGVDAEEIAITRNSSESLQICQMGLDLKAGDEVVACALDYPRMLTAFRQRERRDGIKLVLVNIPVPCEDDDAAVRAYEQAMTPRTRAVLVSHVVNITGQIMPVKRIVAMARARGVPVIVDGAHAFCQIDFALRDLECDYYGVSLHKWLQAPVGNGLLYVRKEKIAGLWPLMAAGPEQSDNIRKFEEIGTHPEGIALSIAESLTFHQAIGGRRKEARLRYLRDRWARPVLEAGKGRARLHTSLNPRFSCAIGNLAIEGLEPAALQAWLWERKRILVTTIAREGCPGIRVTPSVYTTVEEVDRFRAAIEEAMSRGIA